MATNIPITHPEKFDFKKPDEWLKWKRRFEHFLSASGLDKEDEARQASTLLYCLGEEAHDVLASTSITTEDSKKYSKVLKKFDEHFDVRKNVIFERARFNKRNQLDGETAEEYITVLYGLIKSCDYGALKDEMLRYRIVAGIQDMAVSEKLQLDALEGAKKQIRQLCGSSRSSYRWRIAVTIAAWERSEDPDHSELRVAPTGKGREIEWISLITSA
jgi:hypothetical protein